MVISRFFNMITIDHLVCRIVVRILPIYLPYGLQILVRVLPIDGPQVHILHVMGAGLDLHVTVLYRLGLVRFRLDECC